jgi:hypothetical protein
MRASRLHLIGQRVSLTQPVVDAFTILALVQHFASVLAILDVQVAVTGIIAVARSFVNDAAYDPSAEYINTRAAMVSARNSLRALVPIDAQGKFLYQSADAAGNLVNVTFTDVQLAPSVALLDAVTASISNGP